jgi:hypothetical protein
VKPASICIDYKLVVISHKLSTGYNLFGCAVNLFLNCIFLEFFFLKCFLKKINFFIIFTSLQINIFLILSDILILKKNTNKIIIILIYF